MKKRGGCISPKTKKNITNQGGSEGESQEDGKKARRGGGVGVGGGGSFGRGQEEKKRSTQGPSYTKKREKGGETMVSKGKEKGRRVRRRRQKRDGKRQIVKKRCGAS